MGLIRFKDIRPMAALIGRKVVFEKLTMRLSTGEEHWEKRIYTIWKVNSKTITLFEIDWLKFDPVTGYHRKQGVANPDIKITLLTSPEQEELINKQNAAILEKKQLLTKVNSLINDSLTLGQLKSIHNFLIKP